MRYYVASDIHGFYTEFMDALKESGYFSDTGDKKLVICGDLFDRGLEPAQLQKYIVDLLDKDDVILIRGNHEDLFCDLVENGDYRNPSYHHIVNGTYYTLIALTSHMLSNAKETPYYRTIIPSMRDYYETDKYVFVHGWIPKGDWKNGNWSKARWLNGIDEARKGNVLEGKTIVCGHWHCSYGHALQKDNCSEFGPSADFSPYYAPGIIAIDACTAYSHKVNVVVLED